MYGSEGVKLSSVYTLVYQNKKKYPRWAWPPLLNVSTSHVSYTEQSLVLNG